MMDNLDELNERFKRSAEDFSMLPSSNVWKNVERDIRKRERKRRFFIFFFVGIGLVIGATGLLLNHSAKKNSGTDAEHLTQSTTSSSVQKNNTQEQSQVHTDASSTTGTSAEATSPAPVSSSTQTADADQYNAASTTSTAQHDVVNGNTQHGKQIKFSAKSEQTNTALTGDSKSGTAPGETQPKTNASLSIVSPVAENNPKPAEIAQLNPPSPEEIKTITSDSVNPPTSADPTGKWSVALGIAPALSFAHSKEDNNYQYIAQYRDSTDRNLLTFNAHANLGYKITPQIELFTGLSLINIKQELLRTQVVYEPDSMPASGPAPPAIVMHKAYAQIYGDSLQPIMNKYTFLEIPFGIHYNILSARKFSIRLQPHIAFNLLVRSSGYIYDYNLREYRKFTADDPRKINFSYGGGIAFRYALRPDLFFELTPGYQVFTAPFHYSSFAQKFQQAELRFSLRYILPE